MSKTTRYRSPSFYVIKDYRRVNNRYEQKALNYEQIIFFSINNIILNKFKNLSFIDYEFKIELYGVNI